jgi:CRP/FNR family cyclic AMP-dependent transcriptional regulator
MINQAWLDEPQELVFRSCSVPLSDSDLLAGVALFDGLTPKQWSWLRDNMQTKTFPAGTNIITAEQPGEVVYFILDGTVKIYMVKSDGTTVILAILGPGDVVGEMSLIDSAGRSANVLTLEDSNLIWMDRIAFQRCLETIPKITYNLVRILSQRVRLANEQIQALASLDVYGRVARQFLAFAERYGKPVGGGAVIIPIRLTQTDLAELVGASRKRVNQVIVSFKRTKTISVDSDGRIIVHNHDALARLCQ